MQELSKVGNLYELRADNLEDLWLLSQFISPGDDVFASDERKIKVGSENNPKITKKIIKVELRVRKTSFENEVLRVSGEITNETEFTSIGSSHTLTFKVNDNIKVLKCRVLKFEEKMLKTAIESKKTTNFIALFDKDDLIAAEFGDFNYKVLFEEKGLGSKKYTSEEINEEEQKYKLIKPFIDRGYANIILAGPGMFKENLKKYLLDKGIKTESFIFHDVTSQAMSKLVNEVNKMGFLKDNQIALESDYVSKLLLNIEKGGKFAYSLIDVERKVNEGSCEVLLISTKFLDKAREEGTYEGINELMRLTEDMRGELIIVQSKFEPGKILDGLTGIGGILRY